MPNLAALLKQEVARLCRREMRREVGAAKKTSANYRRDIATLKRKVTELEHKSVRLTKLADVQSKTATREPPDRPVRFVTKGFRTLRMRLGLSASQLGKLLEVSEQSVYNWETGHARPRQEQLTKIVALRSLGKREAHRRLKELAAARS